MGHRLLQLGLMRVYDPAHVQLASETAQLGPLHHVRCVHRNVHEVRRSAQLILNQSLVHDIHSLRWLDWSRDRARDDPCHAESRSCRPSVGDGRVRRWWPRHDRVQRAQLRVRGLRRGRRRARWRGHGTGDAYDRATRRSDLACTSAPIGSQRFAEAYRIEDAVWLQSIAAGATVGPSAWDGLVAERVVESAIESLRERRPVEVTTLETPNLYR